MKTQKPAVMAIATSVLMAGIGNALIYSLGYAALVAFKFITQDSGDATFGSFLSAFIITLVFTMLLSNILTFVLAFPIALICRMFGWVGNRAYLIAPTVGAVLASWVASKLDVAITTYVAIFAFSYIAAAIMWLALEKGKYETTPSTAAIPAT